MEESRNGRELQKWMRSTSEHLALAQVNFMRRRGDVLDLLGDLVDARKTLEVAVRSAVRVARERDCTWEEIAEWLGVTRQGAWDRYRDREVEP